MAKIDEIHSDVKAIRTVLVGLDGNNGLVSEVRALRSDLDMHKTKSATNWGKVLGFGIALSTLGGIIGAVVALVTL